MNIKNFTHQSNIFFGSTLFGRDFTAFVQRLNLPGISFSNIELSKTATKFYIQGDTPNYENLTIDLIVDEEFIVWREIMNHFQLMTKVGNGDQTPMVFSSFLHIFNEKDKSILRIDFTDCVLESISSLEFDTTSDDQELTISLSINYAYFTFNNDNHHQNIKTLREKTLTISGE